MNTSGDRHPEGRRAQSQDRLVAYAAVACLMGICLLLALGFVGIWMHAPH